MNRDRAKEAIDKAADDDIAGLFNNLRTNKLVEAADKALEQFTTGVRNLRRDIETAKAIIDFRIPGVIFSKR